MSDLLTLSPELVTNVRRTTLHGREYVVADVTILKEGVLSGSKGPLFYPFEEIARRPGIWNGVPLTNGHPTDSYGNPISGRSPEALNKFGLGYFFGDTIDASSKTRKGQIWVDVQVANRITPDLIPALESTRQIDVSTGLFTSDQLADNNAIYNGTKYTHIARDHIPDHLAILLKERGACSIKDGCGINVNATTLTKDLFMDVVQDPMMVSRNCPKCGAMLGPGSTKCSACGKKISAPSLNSLTEVPMDRTQLVNWLTTNCACWKGKEEVLKNEKSFSDDDLKSLKANAENSTLAINTLREVGTTLGLDKGATLDDLKTAVTTVNEKAKMGGKADPSDDEDDEDDDKKGKGKMKTNKEVLINALKEIPEKEVLELFPSLKQTVNAAGEVVNEKRMELMRQLVANVSNESEKKAKLLKLKNKSLPELREMLEFVGTRNTETPKDDNETFLANFFANGSTGGNYSGSQGTDPTVNATKGTYDKSKVLLPTLNVFDDGEEEVA